MNKKNFNKIILVSLCDKFSSELGRAVSEDLNMLFCDTKEMMEYELVDRHAIEELCSVDYLKACERKIIKHIASFEGVVVSMDYDYLVRNFNLLEEKSLIIFLQLSKTFVKENADAVSSLAYEGRTDDLKTIADVCISLRKTDIDFALNKVEEELGRLV